MNVIKRIRIARDLCLDDYINNYPYNKVLPKISLIFMLIVLGITIAALV